MRPVAGDKSKPSFVPLHERSHPVRINGCLLPEDETQFVILLGQFRQAGIMRLALDQGHLQQILNASGRLSIAVHKLIQHILVLILSADGRDALVQIQFLVLIRDIGIRQECVDGEIDRRVEFRAYSGLALQLHDRCVEQFAVQVISDFRHMS